MKEIPINRRGKNNMKILKICLKYIEKYGLRKKKEFKKIDLEHFHSQVLKNWKHIIKTIKY